MQWGFCSTALNHHAGGEEMAVPNFELDLRAIEG